MGSGALAEAMARFATATIASHHTRFTKGSRVAHLLVRAQGTFSSFRYLPGSVGFGTNQPGLPSASRPRRAPGTGGRPASNAGAFAFAGPSGKKPLSCISATADLNA